LGAKFLDSGFELTVYVSDVTEKGAVLHGTVGIAHVDWMFISIVAFPDDIGASNSVGE